jgi:hypothetical protein
VAKKPPQPRKKAASVRGKCREHSNEELQKRSLDSTEDVATFPKTIDGQALSARVEERQNMIDCEKLTRRHDAASSKARETTELQQNQSEASLHLEHPTGKKQAKRLSMVDESASQTTASSSVAEVDGSLEDYSKQSQGRPSSKGALPDLPLAAPTPPPICQALLKQSLNTAPVSSKPSLEPIANPLTDSPPSLVRDLNLLDLPTLAEWAKAPEEERRTSLETFICRSIQDENFLKLCKDLDGTWQRVFLGKML